MQTHRPRLLVALAALALLVAASPGRARAQAVPGELFYHSFDERPNYADRAFGETRQLIAPYFIRKYKRVERRSLRPGRLGKALFQPHTFQAHGNVSVRRGTICFWYRQEQAMGKMYFPILEIRSVEPYFWWRYLSIHGFHGRVHAEFCDRDCRQHMFAMPGFKGGKWNHIAVAWDCLKGIRLFLNGKLAATNWGKDSWPVMGVYPDKFSLACRRKSGYDDLRVYAYPLNEAQVAAVYRNAPLPPSRYTPDESARRGHRREEMSWTRTDALPALRPGRALTAVSAPVVSAKGLKRWVWRGVDGRTGDYWPSNYQGYKYQDGGGYHLVLEPGSVVNYMTIAGRFRGDLYLGRDLERPPVAKRLLGIEPTGYVWRSRLSRPIRSRELSFFRRKLDGELEGNDNTTGSVCAVKDFRSRMCNLQMFDLTEGKPKRFPIELTLAPEPGDAFAQLPPWFAQALVSLYGAPDRGARFLAPAAAGRTLPLGELAATHLFTPPVKEETPLDAVTLEWTSRIRRPCAIRVQVHDPVTPRRDLVSFDARMTGPGPYRLTLDHIDTIVPRGSRLWLTVTAEQETALNGLKLTLGLNRMAKVLRQYETRQMGMIKDIFMFMSEARPWAYVDSEEKARFLGRVYKMLGDMYEALHQLRKHVKRNALAEGINLWTHPDVGHPYGSAPLRAEHKGAPLWAVYAHLSLEKLLGMPYWWIDNRQVPNGEFGSALGDDSDLVQDWPSLAFITDRDGKLRRSLDAVSDACWKRQIEDGINRRRTDSLHAYEAGMNAAVQQALLNYGDPVCLERMMLSAKTVRERLMGRTANGHLHFRSWWYGSRDVVTELRYGVDKTGNSLMLHPAMLLAYYSRNPRAVKICRDYARAWIEDYYANGKKWPAQIRFEGHKVEAGRRPALNGYGFIYLLNAVHDTTGDPLIEKVLADSGVFTDEGVSKHAVSLMEWSEQTGLFKRNREYLTVAKTTNMAPLGTRRLSDPRYDWKYLQWRMTGDKDALVVAAKRLAERMSVTLALQTEGEQSADRVQLSKKLIDRMYLGGVAAQRNELWPRHVVTYEGLSKDFAALVLDRSPKTLRVLLYNFERRAQKGLLRVWGLENGEYAVRFGPDANRDDKLDKALWRKTLPLRRYSPVEIVLPSRKLMLIEFAQTRKGDDLFKRADLAVSARDAKYDAPKRSLTFVVHNIGSTASAPTTVEARDARGKLLKTFTLPAVEAPVDLLPRRVTLTLDAKDVTGPVKVSVDPEGKVREICEENNIVAIPLR